MNEIVEYIKKYRAENPTGWRKWTIGVLVAILTVVVIAAFAIQAALRGKELARLQTERDAAKEAKHRAEVDQKLAKNEEEAAKHEAAADLALARVQAIEEEIHQLQDQHKLNESIIDSIRSWDDVDKKVN